MRNARQLFGAVVLTVALTLSAFAGEIDTGIAPQPTPAPIMTEGEIDTPQVAGEISTTVTADPLVEGAWSLLQIVLTLV